MQDSAGQCQTAADTVSERGVSERIIALASEPEQERERKRKVLIAIVGLSGIKAPLV